MYHFTDDTPETDKLTLPPSQNAVMPVTFIVGVAQLLNPIFSLEFVPFEINTEPS